MARRELEFADIAEETGGVAWLPVTLKEMLSKAAEAPSDIDSQYVVAYRPGDHSAKRSLANTASST